MNEGAPPPAAPRRRRHRRLAWALGVPAALVLAVAAGEVAGWPFLRQPLQQRLADTLAVPVRLEAPFHLRLLWRPHLAVQRLHVGAGGGLDLPHLVAAERVDLAWRWGDVWRAWRGEAPWRVQHLQAASLDARLVRPEPGRASWQLGRGGGGARGEGSGLPRFGRLQVDHGRVLFDDRPLDTRLNVVLEGGEGTAQGAGRGYRAQVEGRWQRLPLALQVQAGAALPLVAEGAEARPVPVRVEGRAGAARLRFDGQAAALLGDRSLDGRIEFAGPSLAPVGEPLGVTLPQTPPFELQGRLVHADGVWRLVAERAAIGQSRLNGDFRFDPRTKPARLDGRLGGARLALADLGPAVGTPPPAAKSKPEAKPDAKRDAKPAAERTPRRVLPQGRFDLPSLRAMQADVQVAIDELRFAGDGLRPLQALRGRVLLADGALALRDVSATFGGGRFRAESRLVPEPAPARWQLDLGFEQVDLAAWVPALRPDTPPADPKRPRREAPANASEPYLSGTLGGRVQVQGRGQSTAEILGTLDGSAQLALDRGAISHLVTEALGLDLAQGLGVWVRGDEPLPMRCARAALVAKDGLVRIERFVLDNRDSTLRAAGQVNLRDETLAARIVSRPKDVSPLSLRTPVTLGGTLAQPAVGIEGRKLAGKVIGSLVLGALVGPLAALVPLLDTGDAEAGDPCAPPKAPATESPRHGRNPP